MTTVIHYKTPYIMTGKGPFILSFALGNDVSLGCVFGLPTLLTMGISIGLASGLLSCTELNRDFPLDLQPLGKDLPEGTILNHYTNTISYKVSTNLLHHTSADGNSHPTCYITPSDNIHMTNHCSKIKYCGN